MTVELEVKQAEGLELKERLMAEVERAVAEQEPYAIIASIPQRLPGEEISDVIQVGARCAVDLVRDGDVVGLLDGEIIVVGLSGTTPNLARVFAYRLQSDLRLRTHALRNTVWETAFACLPQDGESSEDLLQNAIERAITRRRRLGA
ncbi:MAG: hypothetical protein IH865_02795 [Chloroflexi bacterium]|nr:hypothetical protein [Chloroflexota bacterium]